MDSSALPGKTVKTMNNWRQQFENEDIFFITPDVKKGLGFTGILPKYHIICSYPDPIIPSLRNQGANIFCLSETGNTGVINNSAKLLEKEEVQNYIKTSAKTIPKILFFKPSLKLEILIRKYGFVALGNTADINEVFENKLNLHNLLYDKNLSDQLAFCIDVLHKLTYKNLVDKFNLPFVVQFGHGWAGKTTFFISNENDFNSLSKKYPFTRVKVCKYITGFTVLNNCCIYKDKIFVSSPAVQIDGIDKLNPKKQITCGRQWPVAFLDRQQIDIIGKFSQTIGQSMMQKGYRGYFGLDFLIENKSGKVFVSEINARMTASSAFYTRLEHGRDLIPLMAYHLGSFLNKGISSDYRSEIEIHGSQIILKNSNYNIKIDKNFGVFKIDSENELKYQRNGYSPENLSEDEFIYSKNDSGIINEEKELARIETKKEVLVKPHQLSGWIDNILL